MSNQDDLNALKESTRQIWQKVNESDSTFRQGLSLASDVAGVISIIGIPAIVQSLLDFVNGHNPLQDALASVETLLHVTLSFEQAEADLTQMQTCTALATAARSALRATLEETLPYSNEALDSLQKITLNSVDTLEQDPFWRRVFFTELAYFDFWSGSVVPPSDEIVKIRPDRSFAFDYRLTLPCYLSAITDRQQALVILLATNFVKREAIIKEISQRATSLAGLYQRILKGFAHTPIPQAFPDIQYGDPPPLHSVWDPPRIVGIVDSYVGDGVLASYPCDLYPNPSVGPFASPPPPEYLEFAQRYRLAIMKREKALYTVIGLDTVWESVQELRRAATQATEPFDPHLYWSAREVMSVLDQQAPAGTDLSLFESVQRLATIGKVDNTGQFVVSWRAALEAAAV
jgi:hypothetical protein